MLQMRPTAHKVVCPTSSNVPTVNVSPEISSVTTMMTAEMEAMKRIALTQPVKEITSPAQVVAVSTRAGYVMGTMTVMTMLMKLDVKAG